MALVLLELATVVPVSVAAAVTSVPKPTGAPVGGVSGLQIRVPRSTLQVSRECPASTRDQPGGASGMQIRVPTERAVSRPRVPLEYP